MANAHAKRIIKQRFARAKRESQLYAERILKPNFSETSFCGPRSYFSKCVHKPSTMEILQGKTEDAPKIEDDSRDVETSFGGNRSDFTKVVGFTRTVDMYSSEEKAPVKVLNRPNQ